MPDEEYIQEYLPEEREVEEVRYQGNAQWYRTDQPHDILEAVVGPPIERRTIRQRKVRQTFADGHSIEGWETQD